MACALRQLGAACAVPSWTGLLGAAPEGPQRQSGAPLGAAPSSLGVLVAVSIMRRGVPPGWVGGGMAAAAAAPHHTLLLGASLPWVGPTLCVSLQRVSLQLGGVV